MTRKKPLPKDAYHRNAHIYKILANSKRLEVLNLLGQGEQSGIKLRQATRLTKANLSQHLALLRHNGLVRARREGVSVYYSLVDARIIEPCRILHRLRVKHQIR